MVAVSISVAPCFVHQSDERFAREEPAEVLSEIRVLAFPQFWRDASSMRRNHAIVEHPKWRVRRQRFGAGYVQRCAANAPLPKSFDQCGFIDKCSTANIQDVGVRLHGSKLLAAKRVLRRWGHRRTKHHEVGFG